ncbi:MAG: GNAT family protein [Sulfitobacter sp.]|jgi:RimJ/RimL family protein N-acetyltransferase|nr:GNAT family protein [Sulfitobacter sp.]
MTDTTVPVLEDAELRLRPPHESDVAARLALGNTPEIQHMFGLHPEQSKPLTQDGAQAWVDLQLATPNVWMIELGGRLVGNVFLHTLNWQDRRASLALGILDPDLLGKGYGSRVLHLLLDHAFGAMGLHRIALRVLDYNARAIAAYAKAGFVVEGREREAALVGGRYHDDLSMGLLAHEYQGAST